jgi:membrane associated rhomboid family serine protease
MQFGPRFTPDVVKWLIGGCIGLHLVAMYVAPAVYGWLALTPAMLWEKGAVWQLATAPLLSFGGLALLFDALVLWMFGSELAVRWGRERFLTYLGLCGGGGAAVLATIVGLLHLSGVDVGWSTPLPLLGSVTLALILAYSLMFSEREALLFFVVPVRTLYFVPGLLLVKLVLGAPLVLWIADFSALAIGLAWCWQAGETRMTLQLVLHKFRRWRMRGKLRAIDNDELRRRQRRRNLH